MRYNGMSVNLKFTKYVDNDRLGVVMLCEDDSVYGVVTVNIPDEEVSGENCSFVDINNFGDGIINFLENNNIAEFTGRIGASGFCVYPEYRFKEVKIDG